MKKLSILIAFIIIIIICLFSSCGSTAASVEVAATTLPVYEFTTTLCEGTDISVGQVVTESVSCLHDYTLQVSQMRMLESARVVVISGAGLENFMDDALTGRQLIDASQNTHMHEAGHDHDHSDSHHHDQDPHIWLSPENAKQMARNICEGLTQTYPQHEAVFESNLAGLLERLDQLDQYGKVALSDLSCRELITFHDGFGYFAEHYDLHILRAVEEESGSEASAAELIELIQLTDEHALPAVFTERNGSQRAAGVISAETGAAIYTLDMGLSGSGYFDTMYHNIDTIKEALG